MPNQRQHGIAQRELRRLARLPDVLIQYDCGHVRRTTNTLTAAPVNVAPTFDSRTSRTGARLLTYPVPCCQCDHNNRRREEAIVRWFWREVYAWERMLLEGGRTRIRESVRSHDGRIGQEDQHIPRAVCELIGLMIWQYNFLVGYLDRMWEQWEVRWGVN